jgi:AcrR family transcriptional regulator
MAALPETSRAESGSTRDRLLAAAVEVFVEQGYEGARVQDIARAAGLTTGAIYANFRGKGDFNLDATGRVTRRRSGRIAPFIFTGIQLVSHRLLRDAPEGPFSTNVLWDRAIAEGRLYGIAFTGQWFEVGTPEAIPATEAALKEG